MSIHSHWGSETCSVEGSSPGSAGEIHATLQWRVDLPALWYPQPSLWPNRKIKGHYSDSVSREPYALFESGIMVLRSWGSPSMTGRKSICVLCFASHSCIIFIQPFQLECGNSGSWALITHPAAQSEEWLVMSQEVGKLSDGEKHDGVYSCLFLIGKWKNLHFSSSKGLNFVECLQLHHEDSCCCLLIWQSWWWRGDFALIQPIEWKKVFPWIETVFLYSVFI